MTRFALLLLSLASPAPASDVDLCDCCRDYVDPKPAVCATVADLSARFCQECFQAQSEVTTFDFGSLA